MSSLLRDCRTGVSAVMWRGLHALRGDSPFRFAAEVERRQWQSAAEIRALQDVLLLALVQHAYDRVPFYRPRIEAAFGSRPVAPFDRERYARMGILTKQELREHGRQLLTADPGSLLAGQTSGSTGVPTNVWFDRNYLSYVWAVQRRALNWFGVEPWDRLFFFGRLQHGWKGRAKQKLLDVAIGRMIRSSMDLSPAGLDRVLAQVRRYRPRWISGYSSGLFHLCRHAEAAGTRLDDLGVKLMMPVSEQVLEEYDATFARVLRCGVTQEYGSVEVGSIAHRCPAGTMHPAHDHVYLEVLDDRGQPVAEGQTGRVVLTTFRNLAMPLLRYELGDLAQLTSQCCSCGRFPGLPAFQAITGRTMDHIIDRNGRLWHAMMLSYAFKHVHDTAAFREVQGTQAEPGKVHVLIVPGPAFTAEHAEHYAAVIAREMEHGVEVTWETVEQIEREGSGKFKYFKRLPTVNQRSSDAVPPLPT